MKVNKQDYFMDSPTGGTYHYREYSLALEKEIKELEDVMLIEAEYKKEERKKLEQLLDQIKELSKLSILASDRLKQIKELVNILQVTEKQLTRGMTQTERKHTLQHITDVLGDDSTL